MHRWQVPVTIENSAHGQDHQTGERATHPIEPPWRTLAALLSQGTEALAFARHKQSSGLFVSGLSLAGSEPASSGPSEAQGMPAPGLASARHDGPLGRVQLRFLGSFNKPGRLCRRSVSDLVKDLKILIAKSNVAAQ